MKFGLFYDLQTHTGDWVTLYQDVLEQAATAEKCGFEIVKVTEHHFVKYGWIPSPMVMCGALAAVTKKVRIGPAVALLPINHPVRLAEETAVLDVLSNGRAILALGLGSRPIEFDAYGVSLKERRARFDEGVTLIQRLLSEEGVTLSGRNFRLNDVTLAPRPVQRPRPPIWIGADFEPGVRGAARLGDAWEANPLTSDKMLKKHLEIYLEELRRMGKNIDVIERPLLKWGYIAEDADSAWDEAEESMMRLHEDEYYVWGAFKDDEGNRVDPSKTPFEEIFPYVKRRMLFGGPDDYIAAIERYEKDFGFNIVIFEFQTPGMPSSKAMKAIQIMGEKVIPYFRDEEE